MAETIFSRFRFSRSRFFLPALLAVIGGCGRAPEPSQPQAPPVLVRTAAVSAPGDTLVREFPIFAQESKSARLSFRVPGQLEQFDPILGTKVAKDEVIARLDGRDYELAAERLRLGIAEAEAMLKAMKTGARTEDIEALNSQIAGAQTAAANASRQLRRMENLHSDGTVSDVQLDAAQTTNDAAAAHLETLKTQLAKAHTGARAEEIEAMEAKIAGLNVDLKIAENKLGDTILKAPFDGVIAEKFCDNHETIAPGAAIVEIVDIDSMEATVNLPEEVVRRRENIETLVCRFDSLPDQTFPATIKEIGRTPRRENLSYPMTIKVDMSQAKSTEPLLSGMVGTVSITLKSPGGEIIIPSSALVSAETGASAVWLFDSAGSKVTSRAVEVSAITDAGAVISGGLSGGETIVTAGARSLEEGQPVRLP
ncbi:MAG: efflux RND transporter periplasmic adaptor subunit [Thermoguttaceae bacterium]|nr:efflux RND transporter periplasmic adaptor subunit [Thermoguttaceae bacterium]